MEIKEYKEKRFDKLTRDLLQKVNRTPSFGYGESVDMTVKLALSNYLLTLATISELSNVDIEILVQSVNEETRILTDDMLSLLAGYKKVLEENS